MIYLYETISGPDVGEIRRYEIKQSIHEPSLTHHPDTGEPIRRVILGGMGIMTGKSSSRRSAIPSPPRGGCGCGHGGCGH
jgi:hypothetical protein